MIRGNGLFLPNAVLRSIVSIEAQDGITGKMAIFEICP